MAADAREKSDNEGAGCSLQGPGCMLYRVRMQLERPGIEWLSLLRRDNEDVWGGACFESGVSNHRSSGNLLLFPHTWLANWSLLTQIIYKCIFLVHIHSDFDLQRFKVVIVTCVVMVLEK